MASSGNIPRRRDAGPMAMRTEAERKVGSFLEVDAERGIHQGRFIRFKAILDVRTPLLRGSTVQMADGKEVWVYFKYERLPWFCFHCGCMGYVARDLFQYGDELRASPLRRIGFSQGPRLNDEKVKRKLIFKPGRDRVDVRKEANPVVKDRTTTAASQPLRSNFVQTREDDLNGDSVRGGSQAVVHVCNPIDSPLGKIVAKVQGFPLKPSSPYPPNLIISDHNTPDSLSPTQIPITDPPAHSEPEPLALHHVPIDPPKTITTWKRLAHNLQSSSNLPSGLAGEWLVQLAASPDSSLLKRSLCLAWALWKDRNQRIFQDKASPPSVIANSAMNLLTGYQDANKPR
ncbi:hypothetical protein Tsubulata_007851 [Turnera subulata]|uniref:Zinc knuckle CX2CX4HX4C domain-containing protein n=1 Tax=Turnera subulata TaxID=218843 RepID=A0A9Q0JPP9_9ROSI|nr:hypothetical protein Tsubulata_007851 [Turnera subulata]